ncbi:MAG: FecR domain-containing protein [Comamonadaceae bacterium]|nr:FecR domain-containing protein [Comamonadaceae bacterium]
MNSLNMPGFLPHRLACFLLSVGLVTPLMAAQGSAEVVGEVTLLIGQAQLVGADDVVRTVERGQPVRAGDRIETREGGHVHVRFVDGGRLSVRPSSRLQIENYSHSATQPQGSAIKFRLDEGVIRSITGTWGEEARERFRLNTPMAAIGIKGTDFVVKSDANATAASVYAGAILLAPLGDCAAPLGSCQKGRERLLSADMKGDTLSQTFEQASAAGRESVAFGTAHVLTRNASPAGAVLTTTDAAVNFRLAGSSAFFQRNFDHGVEAAKVDNGTLAVDFSRATFATQLGVSSPTLGADSVVASGSIGKDGVMRTTSANATVLGATTLDGKEAGYLFEKSIPTGALRGVTLWGR